MGAGAFGALGLVALLLVVVYRASVTIVRAVRPGRARAASCGACGYEIAPNPAGLTRCPECGRDLLEVGIIPPRRGAAAVSLRAAGISLTLLAAIGALAVFAAAAAAVGRVPVVSASHSSTFSPHRYGNTSAPNYRAGLDYTGTQRGRRSTSGTATVWAGEDPRQEVAIDLETGLIRSSGTTCDLGGTPFGAREARILYAAAGIRGDDPAAQQLLDNEASQLAGVVSAAISAGASRFSPPLRGASMPGLTSVAGSSTANSGLSELDFSIGPLAGAPALWLVILPASLLTWWACLRAIARRWRRLRPS